MPIVDDLPILRPDLQVSFSERLRELRGRYLDEALAATVASLDIASLDSELSAYVQPGSLRLVASQGIRGEVVFPVPCVLHENPYLLGYYRLLLGVSAKEFYHRDVFGAFQTMEVRGRVSPRQIPDVPALCKSLVKSAEMLVEAIPAMSLAHVHDLQLLALGPSLRGGELNRIGQRAAQEIFDLIRAMLCAYSPDVDGREMRFDNDSGRGVTVRFAGDPDVVFREQLPSGPRTLLSIEIKGGTDASNVYNRIGEAEKSHRSQYELGCRVFWTIIRAHFRPDKAREKSPTTTEFFRFDEVVSPTGAERSHFWDNLASLIGVRTGPL